MKPEILAPAGSMEALKAAVHAGADAVYLGGDKFGARAYANNFDRTALIDAIEYCHLYGVKVYLTINTLFRNEEIQELTAYLEPFYCAGLDAVIVQDLGVMKYVHAHFPQLPIHASTQMTITTKYAFELIKDYGVTRIVPARELSIEEIADLKSLEIKPEVEVFVQGALCYCYSGQCLMSSMLGGRSGNRGRCAQTCRLPYTIQDDSGSQLKTEGDYLLSPKDLCGLEDVPALIKAGVDSFKIEGRMKRPEYVAACVRAYRKVVDAWYNGDFSEQLIEQYKSEMAEVFNRGGFTKGYYHQKNGKNMMSIKNPGNIGVVIGTITAIKKNQISIQLEKDVYKGDILIPQGIKDNITLTNNIEACKNECIVLNAPKTQRLYKGQKMIRMSKEPLMVELAAYIEKESEVFLKGTLQLITGERAKFTIETELKGEKYSCTWNGDVVEMADNKPLTVETVRDKIGKTGNTRYCFDKMELEISNDAFYPLKALKDLRRNAIAELEQIILDKSRRIQVIINDDDIDLDYSDDSMILNEKNVVMVSNEEQYHIVKTYDCFERIYLDLQYFDVVKLYNIIKQENVHKIAIVLPPIMRLRYLKEVKDVVEFVQKEGRDVGIVVRNIDEFSMLKHFRFEGLVITDYSLYAMNDWAAAFLKRVYPNARLSIPVELNEYQMKTLNYVLGNCEVEVYGYQQLMVSAQCLQNTVDICNESDAHFVMRDRYLKNFYVSCICKYCYNLIYNGIPTVLYDFVNRSLAATVTKRIHFTKETAKEVSNVLTAFLEGDIPEGEKTRGHYKRGVE